MHIYIVGYNVSKVCTNTCGMSGGSGSSGSGRGQLPNERRGNPPTGGRVSGGMTVVGTGTNANLTSTNIQGNLSVYASSHLIGRCSRGWLLVKL